MEHTVYLAAKAFIEEVKPRAPKTAKNKGTTKNGAASTEDLDDSDNNDQVYNDNNDDDNDDWVLDWAKLDEIPVEQEIDDIVNFTAGDVLGKALALVNQVFPILVIHSACC